MRDVTVPEFPGLTELVKENTQAIAQLSELLSRLPVALYRQSMGVRQQHVVGKHVRHIIDHYQAFLRSVKDPGDGQVNYEHRERQARIEMDPQAASDQLASICHRISGLCSDNEPLAVENLVDDKLVRVPSSVGRELIFLASHTVHHMAIIAMLVEQEGVQVPDSFGVHPSTQRYQQTLVRSMPAAGNA